MTSHAADVDALLARRHDNGDDCWAGPGNKVYVGNPFSTLGCLGMLHELDVPADHEAVAGALERVLAAGRDDGRIRLGPKAPLSPCYTAEAARILCRFGLVEHPVVQRTIEHLRGAVHDDGGWRCSFSRFGKGPETVGSNPGATLYALDVLRHVEAFHAGDAVADAAVDTLLEHWTTRAPTGPCHWGIGSTFLQIEYPFVRYNLFLWVYVLSFFSRARGDERFRTAHTLLSARRDDDGLLVVEKPHRGLKGLAFCARGQPSAWATRRMDEIDERVIP